MSETETNLNMHEPALSAEPQPQVDDPPSSDPEQLTGPYTCQPTTLTPQQLTMRDFFPVFSSQVTSLIFLYACQIDVDPFLSLKSNPRWKRQSYPLWLGHVCKAWRDLVWRMPDIWSTIIIRITILPECIKIQTKLLEEWLERSSGKPLNIYLEDYHSTSQAPRDEAEERSCSVNGLLSLLAQDSHRWRTVDFHLPCPHYQYLSLSKPPLYSPTISSAQENTAALPISSEEDGKPSLGLSLSLPQLRNASLHDSQKTVRSELPLNLEHASSLQALSLSYMMTKPDLFLHFPTTQITRLTLTQVLRINPRHLFDQFPHLQELTLSFCSVVRKLEPDAASRPITHQNLKTLHITVESEFLFNLLVHQLAFPALESLSLCVSQSLRCTKFLLAFVRRSKCRLKKLTIESTINSDYDLVEFLSLEGIGVDITELRVYDHDVVNPDRRREIKRNKEKGPLPGLGNKFFERFHPYVYTEFVPSLEVFEYQGLLSVEEIDFLEGLILRSRVRERDVQVPSPRDSNSDLGRIVDETAMEAEAETKTTFEEVNAGLDKIAILRRVEIRAEHVYGMDLIAEYEDAQYVWEVIRMVEEGILVLVDRAGMPWM